MEFRVETLLPDGEEVRQNSRHSFDADFAAVSIMKEIETDYWWFLMVYRHGTFQRSWPWPSYLPNASTRRARCTAAGAFSP